METLLKSGLINLAMLAELCWPDINRRNAGAKLRNKVNRINGNKLTGLDLARILYVLEEHGILLEQYQDDDI